MADIYFSSDHHLSHGNILKFTDKEGAPLRTKKGQLFSSIEEHDEYIIDQHNSLVRPQDKVYLLGDLVINKKNLHKIARLNGHKRLVRGNHDIEPINKYLEIGIENIYGVRVFTPKESGGAFFCATHIPVHPNQLYRFGCNVHGHTHSNSVMLDNGQLDKRYLSVCMEKLDDYKPKHMDEIVKYVKDNNLNSKTNSY